MVARDRVADRESEEGKTKGEHDEVQHRRLLAGGCASNAADGGAKDGVDDSPTPTSRLALQR
jgi:hypothetical protein